MIQFVTPALLFGALLFAVPLIIHLLNRQRYRRRPWAAMDFLLAAYKKQRRRLQRENLILLILRCMIPIILALAIARPVLRSSINLPGVDNPVLEVLLFDTSYSMDLQLDGGTSPFQRAKRLSGAILEQLESRSGQNRVTIMTSGLRPHVAMREGTTQRAKAVVANLDSPVDGGSDLNEALTQIADQIEGIIDADIRVHVLTDLQIDAFGEDLTSTPARPEATPDPNAAEGPDQDAFEDTVIDAIRRIQNQENASLSFFDMRSQSRAGDGGQEDNTQIVDLRIGAPIAIAKTQTPVIALASNTSSVARTVEATLEIDGGQPMRREVRLDAGAEAEIEFQVTFQTTGQHRVEVRLAEDALPADDVCVLVVDVRDRVRVVLIEGLPDEPEPALRYTPFVRDILDPTGGEGSTTLTAFAPRTIDSVDFLTGRETLEDADLIVLCGVERLNTLAAGLLRSRLRDGAGVWIMLHPQCEPESYNRHLYDTGKGPLPFRLTEARGYLLEGDRHDTGEIVAPDHPVFADLKPDIYRDILENLPIVRVFGSDPGSAVEGSEVLMRVRDADRTPLLVGNSFGNGRLLLMTSSPSRRPDTWNALDFEITAFPLFHPTAYWLSVPTTDPFNLVAGAPISATVDSRPEAPIVVPPERAGGRPEALAGDVRPMLGDRYALPDYRQTDYAGFYRLELRSTNDAGSNDQGDGTLWFAVRPDPAEGVLTYASHQQLREAGIQSIETGLPANSGSETLDGGIQEIGPLLLYAALIFLVGEAAFARWISRNR